MSAEAIPYLLMGLMLLLAAMLWLRSRAWRQQSGVPDGDIIYTDTGTWRANARVLHSTDLRLVGKPDYLVQQHDGVIIPVEVKTGLAPDVPWEGQVLQLAAYCRLVEEIYGVRPPYGILQYKDHAFAVDYTDDLEDDLLAVLDEMRASTQVDDLEPDHADRRRCAACGVRHACDRRLA